MIYVFHFQESGGSGMRGRSFKLGSYAEGNASRDFYRNVSLPWVGSSSGPGPRARAGMGPVGGGPREPAWARRAREPAEPAEPGTE